LGQRLKLLKEQFSEKDIQLANIWTALRKLNSENEFSKRVGRSHIDLIDFSTESSLLLEEDIANATFGVDQVDRHVQNLIANFQACFIEKEELKQKYTSVEHKLAMSDKVRKSFEVDIEDLQVTIKEMIMIRLAWKNVFNLYNPY